jgi:predicted dinucleotide-binding enzyme
MRLAVIGAGTVGRAVGERWAKGGHAVIYGVPDPKRAKYADLGSERVRRVGEAVRDADVIVLATPWAATRDAIAAAGDLAGRIVIDCTNPLRFTPAEGLHLEVGFTNSGGEQVAQWARGAHVFKTLNQTGAETMADASAFEPRPVMFVAGDSAEHKPKVLSLVTELGFEAIDAGPLVNSRLLEPHAMLWIDQALTRGAGRGFAFAVVRRK